MAGIALFNITCDLTDEGVRHVDDIINLVFQVSMDDYFTILEYLVYFNSIFPQYILLVASEGIQEWMFNEMTKINEINFSFKRKEKPLNYVKDVSVAMTVCENIIQH